MSKQHTTAPTKKQRASAARELISRAAALRELAQAAPSGRTLNKWAEEKAAELEAVGQWLEVPYGTCDDCGEVLQHFSGENVGGVLCPECDGDVIDETTLGAVECDGCLQPRETLRVLAKDGSTARLCSACVEQLEQLECPVCRAKSAAVDVLDRPDLPHLQATCSAWMCSSCTPERAASSSE